MQPADPVLVVSPRYAEDVAAVVNEAGFRAIPVRRPEESVAQIEAEPLRMVVVDARGALTQGLAIARALGPTVQARLGTLLMLLSRTDGDAALAAHDAGATSVLISPFGRDALVNALRLTARQAQRLADAAAAVGEGGEGGPEFGAQDRLTGLATGEQLERWLAGLLAAPLPQPMVVIALGDGRLAPINAAYGRDVADQVLSAVAERLTQIVAQRNSSAPRHELRLLARLAAAEFALGMATSAKLEDTETLAAAMSAALALPFVIGDHVIHLSGRAGIARMDTIGPMSSREMAATLLRRAASALAHARTQEAGTVSLFKLDPAGDPLTRMANLEADLHRAINEGGINLLFQPQMCLATGTIIAVEALVRWEHPVLGLLPAETVLETAASAELAVRLGRHIRARAMQQAARWTGALAGLSISVNVTAADLADPRFQQALEMALGNSGLARDRLVLEVTEGALIDDVRGAARMLEGLRASGLRVALDDFGTGFSSLSWLARLPIDTIKFFRSFTLALAASALSRLVVVPLVSLSRRLGLSVVVEGVEDDAQMAAARHAG
ncbi:EAL domain-containing protein, partial [Polymorphobacter multimanifer]|uniref:EAL domain-containing protein n=1 Tax=Polymorphobacter multimanifer TaxID=1070431 RepID=UPI001A9C8FD9